jgi:hypothetical protein
MLDLGACGERDLAASSSTLETTLQLKQLNTKDQGRDTFSYCQELFSYDQCRATFLNADSLIEYMKGRGYAFRRPARNGITQYRDPSCYRVDWYAQLTDFVNSFRK